MVFKPQMERECSGPPYNFFHNLMHDILRHVLNAFLHSVVGQTNLSQLVGTRIVQDKLCSFKHAGFEESLSNGVWLLLFCNLKRDLV